MGYYTKLHLDVALKYDTPKEVIETIEYIFYQRKEKPNYDFPVLKTDRVLSITTGCSAYFMGLTHSDFRKPRDSEDYYQLLINSNIKNYGNEYELFLGMIAPFVVYKEFIGYIMGEDEEIPRLLFTKEDGTIECKKVRFD